MPMKLVRRPRSPKVLHDIVMSEVRSAWEGMGGDAIAQLQDDVKDWENQPEFKTKITMTSRRWTFEVKYDKRTRAGKIFKWVDEGTGERGNDPAGKAYDITPKNAQALVFWHPVSAMTTPKIKPYNPATGEPKLRITQHVTAPGITARDFTEAIRLGLKRRDSAQGFKQITDKAIKRGARRIGI